MKLIKTGTIFWIQHLSIALLDKVIKWMVNFVLLKRSNNLLTLFSLGQNSKIPYSKNGNNLRTITKYNIFFSLYIVISSNFVFFSESTNYKESNLLTFLKEGHADRLPNPSYTVAILLKSVLLKNLILF